jgi:NAD(P)-dependent dehydrogenase (short-subunit alcohol dehydrogenase family)
MLSGHECRVQSLEEPSAKAIARDRELAAHNMRVKAIAPCPTLTRLTRANYTDPEARRATER